MNPVSETVAVIMRTNDQSGAYIQHSARHGLFRRLLAQSLQRAVHLSVTDGRSTLARINLFRFAELFRRDCFNRSVLVSSCKIKVSIDGATGDECVVLRSRSQKFC